MRSAPDAIVTKLYTNGLATCLPQFAAGPSWVTGAVCVENKRYKRATSARALDGVRGDANERETRRNLFANSHKQTIRTLDEAAERSNHCQATVLDFLNLELSQILRRRGDVEEIERTTRVDRVEAVERGFVKLALERDETRRTSAFGAELFDTSHQSDLNSGEERDKLQEFRTAGFAIQKHLARLRPHATRQTQSFGDDETRNGEHGPTRVNDFSDAVLVNLTFSTEAERVETIVTGESTVEVARDIRRRQETAREVELTVRAYARGKDDTRARIDTRQSHEHKHTYTHDKKTTTRTPRRTRNRQSIAAQSVGRPTVSRPRAFVARRYDARSARAFRHPGSPQAHPDRHHQRTRRDDATHRDRIATASEAPSRANRAPIAPESPRSAIRILSRDTLRRRPFAPHPSPPTRHARPKSNEHTRTHVPYHLESPPFAAILLGAALRTTGVAFFTGAFFTTVFFAGAVFFTTVFAGAGAAAAFLAPRRDFFAGAAVFAGAGAAFLNSALTCIVVRCAGMAIDRAIDRAIVDVDGDVDFWRRWAVARRSARVARAMGVTDGGVGDI